jgi:ribosomal protein S18 acetylase RimI-like enzyme
VNDEFDIRPLFANDDREGFDSQVEPLDRYLRQLARQDQRRHVANCFVVNLRGTRTIAGYFTLSATSLPIGELPSQLAKRLPLHDKLPASLVGRLAVDHRFREIGLGRAMLVDAATRAARSEPAVFALVVDAKDEAAMNFYRYHQFIPFITTPASLFLPITFLNSLKGMLPP